MKEKIRLEAASEVIKASKVKSGETGEDDNLNVHDCVGLLDRPVTNALSGTSKTTSSGSGIPSPSSFRRSDTVVSNSGDGCCTGMVLLGGCALSLSSSAGEVLEGDLVCDCD